MCSVAHLPVGRQADAEYSRCSFDKFVFKEIEWGFSFRMKLLARLHDFLIYAIVSNDMADQERTSLVEKATAIVEESRLSSADKKLLIGRIPFVADAMLQMFVQVCIEDPFGVDAVVKSLKKKLDAQGNLKKIHEIVKQERREVEELLASR